MLSGLAEWTHWTSQSYFVHFFPCSNWLVLCKHRAATAKGTQTSPTHVPAVWPFTFHLKCLRVWPQSSKPADVVQVRTPCCACESLRILFLCKSTWQGMKNLVPPKGAFIPTTCYCQLSSHLAPPPPPPFFSPKFSKFILKLVNFFLSTTTVEMMFQNPALIFWSLILIPA